MGFRELAGDMARTTSGLWRGFADVVDPEGRSASSASPDAARSAADAADRGSGDGSERAPVAGPSGDAMIVPLDTWTRVLEQLGNVHEAGQQLADARERAARAETENEFLREQLRDLKGASGARRARSAAPDREFESVGDGEMFVVESRGTRVRRQVSTWIRP